MESIAGEEAEPAQKSIGESDSLCGRFIKSPTECTVLYFMFTVFG